MSGLLSRLESQPLLRATRRCENQFLLFTAFLVTACPKQGHESRPPVTDDCTLETQLVPNVPGSPGHLIASERNPNGASELATHMRTMVDDLREAKTQVLGGQSELVPSLWRKHRKIRCAWPTAPGDRDAAFDAMAQNYLAKVRVLDSKPKDMRAAFSGVVAACRSCHEATCDGPIAVIDGLTLDAK
jgi:hypothetical protein